MKRPTLADPPATARPAARSRGGPRAPWLAAVALVLVAAGCANLPDVAAGVCGNHVLDPGERCDHDGAGCGAPGTSAACHFTCEAGACPSGWLCGRDHACRQASGLYDLAAPIGGGGDWFELLDVDGDGNKEVVDRGFHVATVYGYGSGALQPVASGATDADLSVLHAFAAGRLRTDDARPLLTSISVYSFDLFTVVPSRGIVPVASASLRLPLGTQRFLGAIRFGTEAARPLVFSGAGPLLDALDLDHNQVVQIDLTACGASKGGTADAIVPDTGAPTVGLIFDQKRACVVDATGSGATARFVGSPLSVAALPAFSSEYTLTQPLLADLDGDHIRDLIALMQTPGATAADPPERRFVVWRRDANGFGAPEVSNTYQLSDDPSYAVSSAPVLATADFDGDGRDDLVDAYLIHLRADATNGDPFGPPHGADLNLYAFGRAIDAGDIDHDGDADLVVSGEQQEGVVACLNDGGARFACLALDSGIPSIDQLFLADVSGDGTNDIIAVGATPDPISGTSGSRLSVIFGQPLGFPRPPAQYIEAYRGLVSGAARSPSVGDPVLGRLPNAADGIMVSLQYSDGIGFARSRGVPEALPSFGLDIPCFEARFVDHTLHAIRCDANPTDGRSTDCKIESFVGGVDAPFAAPVMRAFSRPLTAAATTAYDSGMRFVDLPDEAAPVVMWLEQGQVLIGRITDSALQVTTLTTTAPVTNFYNTQMADTDGPADPNGDGRPELVITTVDDGTDDCTVWVAHAKAGVLGPLVKVAHAASCQHGSPVGFDATFGYGAPFFAGTPGSPPDLLLTVKGANGDYHLARLPADGHGGFGTLEQDPPLFRATAAATPASLPAPADYRYVESSDIDGDGAQDLIFRTSAGAVIAFSHSEL